jgi:hypothetical protein
MNTRQRVAVLSWLVFSFAVVTLLIFPPFPIPDFDHLSTSTLKDLTILCTGLGLASLVVAVFTFILGVCLFFREITQGTVDAGETVHLDPPDADHENEDNGNGQHPRPPDFSNN